ncbi:MAG TPA: ATP-binding cassette domain-containing protein, partial [Polyangia bacterium]
MIDVQALTKTYRVHKRPAGFLPTVRSLFKRQWESVEALRGVDFSIAPGERVGFLGPNGAGKTTTLKILSGLLHPTAGQARVAGFEPQTRDPAFLRTITLVMGQKQQLLWDLPPVDTYAMNRALFDLPKAEADATLAELVELLDIGALITKPTRQLSLGERMKCELAAALLHRPKVLFLDEPTIGLDVSMQARMRQFVRDYNQRHGATVILTTHYMEDVAALCPRVIVIDKGRLVYDGDLRELARRMRPEKRITVRLAAGGGEAIERIGKLVRRTDTEL